MQTPAQKVAIRSHAMLSSKSDRHTRARGRNHEVETSANQLAIIRGDDFSAKGRQGVYAVDIIDDCAANMNEARAAHAAGLSLDLALANRAAVSPVANASTSSRSMPLSWEI